MTERKRAEFLFSFLFASLAILHFVYTMNKQSLPKVDLIAVEKETKYVGKYVSYQYCN